MFLLYASEWQVTESGHHHAGRSIWQTQMSDPFLEEGRPEKAEWSIQSQKDAISKTKCIMAM
jgi:hypothetical protein